MSAAYPEILKLRVRHGFYRSGVCEDFRILPLGGTAERLKNHRLHLRDEGSEIRVFAETRDGKKPVIDLDDLRDLQFGLALNNSAFSLFSDLPETKDAHRGTLEAGQQLDTLWLPKLPGYFFNKAEAAGELSQTKAFEFFDFIPVKLKTAEPDKAITVTLKAKGGETVAKEQFTAIQGKTDETRAHFWIEGSLDIRGIGSGLFTLETNIPGHAVLNVLVRPELDSQFFRTVWLQFPQGAFVKADGEVKPAQTHDVTFLPASNAWNYHINVGKKRASKKFKITHMPAGDEPPIEFEDADESPLVNGGRKLVIRSKTAVPYSDTPRKAIKLLQLPDVPEGADAGAGGPAPPIDPVIEDLPNPSPWEAKAEVFISI